MRIRVNLDLDAQTGACEINGQIYQLNVFEAFAGLRKSKDGPRSPTLNFGAEGSLTNWVGETPEFLEYIPAQVGETTEDTEPLISLAALRYAVDAMHRSGLVSDDEAKNLALRWDEVTQSFAFVNDKGEALWIVAYMTPEGLRISERGDKRLATDELDSLED